MKTIIINGISLSKAKNITGIQRSSRELIYRLDSLLDNTELNLKYLYNENEINKVIVPSELKNIELIPIKLHNKRFECSKIFKKVLKEEDAIAFNIALDPLYVKKQISFIYDVRAAKTKYDPFKFRFKFKLYMHLQKKYCKHIFTDSNYQKNEIKNYLHIKRDDKITTIYMGHEHFLAIKPDYKIFDKYPFLKDKEFYYTLGSLAPHKNFYWIEEVAKRNPNDIFVIAGGKELSIWKDNIENNKINNLFFVGYVSDEESKALMSKCLAFIHPSKYEGFGIPPLEALVSGAKVLCSNSTCLPEIYEDTVSYFNPDNYDINLRELVNQEVGDKQKVLEKCSWDKSATLLLDELIKISNQS